MIEVKLLFLNKFFHRIRFLRFFVRAGVVKYLHFFCLKCKIADISCNFVV